MPKTKPTKHTVLITGGAKRIGRAIAEHLAAAGYDIALHYNRSQKAAETVARAVREKKGRCRLFSADLTNPDECRELIYRVKSECPGFNTLINNASIFERGTIKTTGLASLEESFRVHVAAPWLLIKHLTAACGKGQAVNILDTNIAKNKITHAAYLLSKKSLADLTRLAAVEFAPRLRINAIAPGLILPPAGAEKDHLNRLAKKIPLKRKGSPQDIANGVQFLIENSYVTGQILFIDGGEHLT